MSLADRPSDQSGLQAERTSLAWERTATALFANGALLLFRHARFGGPVVLVSAVVALSGAIVVAVLGLRRARRIARPGGATTPARRPVLLCGATVLVVGVIALVIELLVAIDR
ncbi:MAG: DUF202 domain-containing protein [Pseudonocardia sediminis]